MGKKLTAKIHLNDLAIWGFVLIVAYYFLFNLFVRTQYARTVTGALAYLRYFTLVLLIAAVIRGLAVDAASRHFIIGFLIISLLVIAGTFFFHPEIDQFGDAHTGRVQKLKHGAVPDPF